MRRVNMGYVGEAMEDMLVQKAYATLKKRGYKQQLDSCYYILLGILRRNGEMALNKYVNELKTE